MNANVAESAHRTFRRLWKKAPLWRFTGLSAALLALLFLLFAPANRTPAPAASSNTQASYTPQPKPSLPAPSPSVAATPTPQAPVQPPAEVKAPPLPPTPKLVSPNVQTASLSLATPSAIPTKEGLDNAITGHRFNGSLRVDGFDVPLPPGDWLLLANLRFKTPTAKGEMLYLGQVKNRRLMGAIRVTTARSLSDPGAGFPALKGCMDHSEGNNYVAAEAVSPSGHQSCWIMVPMFLSPLESWADRTKKLDQLDRAAAGDLAAKGVSFPQDMMTLRLTRAETWGLLEVRYMFNPETDHITSSTVATAADTDWQPGTITRFPEKLVYVEKLKHWGTEFWPRFKTAFDAGRGAAAAN
ncbi:hypothetical protein [Dyella sp. Tek66A03]|uniref:hypothetical protein n=1 Tax=Dyella sp. Tek66A03 TaxID=3458298 RepID=UPI00403E5D85